MNLNSNNKPINFKFCFLILHYMALEATENCVKSITEHFEVNEYSIVIVDNGSPNNSGLELEKVFAKEKNIYVLIQKSNLGFARGNNVGFKFAKQNLQCEFICMINNDTLLIHNDFIRRCYDTYKKYHCAVIGPKIIRKDGSVQDIENGVASRGFYILHRYVIKIKLLLSRMGVDTENVAGKVQNILKKYIFKRKKEEKNSQHICVDVRLHGCCWIFTPIFVKEFDGINDKTFLYREEELLYILLKMNHMVSVYNPKIRILHIEDVATDMIRTTSKEKREFIYKNQINSLKILISEMKEYKKNDKENNV